MLIHDGMSGFFMCLMSHSSVFNKRFNTSYVCVFSLCVTMYMYIYMPPLTVEESRPAMCHERCDDFSKFTPLPPDTVVVAPSLAENPSVKYCNQCKNYCLATSFAPGSTICGEHPTLKKDANGKRWCRKCREFICTTRFPVGQRRYVCKKHAWDDNAKMAKKKLRLDPWKRELARLYSLCYNDCRYFNQPQIELTQRQIGKLFVGIMTHDGPESSIEAFGFAVLPMRPHEVLCLQNSAVVWREDRTKLLSVLKKRDWETYSQMVQSLAVAYG